LNFSVDLNNKKGYINKMNNKIEEVKTTNNLAEAYKLVCIDLVRPVFRKFLSNPHVQADYFRIVNRGEECPRENATAEVAAILMYLFKLDADKADDEAYEFIANTDWSKYTISQVLQYFKEDVDRIVNDIMTARMFTQIQPEDLPVSTMVTAN
jgi:hypothetical protein